MSLLTVKGLKAGYGHIQVLHEIDLEVSPGEIVCLIGPNGAGKSTTMGTVSGLLRPVSGDIAFDGKPIARLSAERIVQLGISLVPEGRRVFQPLTVMENLEMGAFRHLRRRRPIRKELDLVFDLFPRLKERADQHAGTLSGGEQQMLAIGRALMSRPRLLMLDEPSMGLAPLVVTEIFRVVDALRDEGLTIFLAEQNAKKALGVADRGYVLQAGVVAQSADASTLSADATVQEAYLGI